MTAATERRQAQADCLAEWVCSPAARAAARHLLELRRLPHHRAHVDDVLMDTAQRVLGRLHRLGPLEVHPDGRDPVVPYARRALDRAVTDLLRGPRWRLVSLDDLDDATPVGVDEERVDLPSLTGELDGIRTILQLQATDVPSWAVAAALVVTALAEKPTLELRPDTATPETGSEGARWRWAGLFYAGRVDCFPDVDEDDDVNRRNRRSRALKTVDRLLADATASAGDP